jgi:anti-sigma factor RsiW
MNGHVESWIDRYLDGELAPHEALAVERHLESCAACRQLADERKALSALLLDEAPAVTLRKSERQFVGEIELQLDRHSPRRVNRPANRPHWGWLAAPVSLVLAWCFVVAVGLGSLALSFFPNVTGLLFGSLGAPAQPASALTAFFGFLDGFAFLGTVDWNVLTGLIALLVVGLLFAGWLAFWWSQNHSSSAGMDFERINQ